jgi:outer membrane protein
MKSITKTKIVIVLMVACANQMTCNAQAINDSLSLDSVLTRVMANYPAIKKTIFEAEAADARIAMAKTAYYPDVNLNTSYSHIGPSSTITLPDIGTFSLFPENNYSAAVNYSQTIYDFGKTARNVSLESNNRNLVNLSAEQLKQKISLDVAHLYYNILFLQEAVKIKDEELQNLNRHLSFVEKKNETGSATKYEVLTTNVRIAITENQKTDLETTLAVQESRLNSFLGNDSRMNIKVKKELQPLFQLSSSDSLYTSAIAERNEMKIALQKISISELRFDAVKSQNNPALNFFASAGIKNGYTPDINAGKANYAVGIGFRVPIFDAGRKKNTLSQVNAEINTSKEEAELTRRNIENEITENIANMQSARQKIAQSELQLQQAKQAYSLAETSFNSGAITNLELLDSSTSLAEAGLSLLKAKIDYSFNYINLKISLGVKIY